MTDLLTDTPVPAQSPKRKFSFRFPNLSHHSSMDKDSHANGNHLAIGTLTHKGRNFSEEIKNVPDLQVSKIKTHSVIFVVCRLTF